MPGILPRRLYIMVMASRYSTDRCQEDANDSIDKLLDLSEKLNFENLSREVPCYSWSEVSPWNMTTANVTYLTSSPRSLLKKKKVKQENTRKLQNVQLHRVPDDTFFTQWKRNYGTTSYDTPTWRFIVNSTTYDYIARSEPSKIRVQDRSTNRSANCRVGKGQHNPYQLDPAMFFDDQLSLALTERDNFRSLKNLRKVNSFDFSSTYPSNGYSKDRTEDLTPNILKDKIVHTRNIPKETLPIPYYIGRGPKSKTEIDTRGLVSHPVRHGKSITDQLASAAAHFRKDPFGLKTPALELDTKVLPRELQHRSEIVLKRVKLLQEYGQTRLETSTHDKNYKNNKMNRKVMQGNRKSHASLHYSDLGLPILPKLLSEGKTTERTDPDFYVDSVPKTYPALKNSNEECSDLHLPSITQEPLSAACSQDIIWEDKQGTLLPPIFGTKVELALSNSNQSLL